MYMYQVANNVHVSLAGPSIDKYMYMYYNIAINYREEVWL